MKNFLLLSLLLLAAFWLSGCKKEFEPVPGALEERPDTVALGSSYAIFTTHPKSEIGLIRRYSKFSFDAVASGDRDSEGFLTNIKTLLLFDPGSKTWMAASFDKGYPVKIVMSNGYSVDLANYNRSDLTVEITITLNDQPVTTREKRKLSPFFFDHAGENLLAGLRIAGDCRRYEKLLQGLDFTVGVLLLTAAVAFPPAGLLAWAFVAVTAIQTASDFSELISDNTLAENIFNDETADFFDTALDIASFVKGPRTPDKVYNALNKILEGSSKVVDRLKEMRVTSNCGMPWSHSTGDPHLLTLDGAALDFQGHGEFVGIKSTSDNFEVQVRQEDISKTGYMTFNTAIAIRTGDDVVSVHVKPNRLYINNQLRDLSGAKMISLKNGATIEKNTENGQSTLIVATKNGDLVKIVWPSGADYIDYYLQLPENRKEKVIGLMGNYDGDHKNDVRTRTGENVMENGSIPFEKLYSVYADGWRITQSNSLFYYDSGKNTESYTEKDFPRNAFTITDAQKTKAEGICRAAGVSGEPFLSNCIVDVAITNNPAMVNSALFGQKIETISATPIPITQEAVDVKRITTFGLCSYILKSDGTLWASGWNDHGRFGIGLAPFDNKDLFKKIMDGVKDIASGNEGNHMLFLKNDNSVWAAGLNTAGEIGNGATDGESVRTAVKIMDNGKVLAIGRNCSFIIRTDQTLWALGGGRKLIDGSRIDVPVPIKVMDDVKEISVNLNNALILKTDNSLWGSGENISKQLNSSSQWDIYPPVKLMDNVRSMAMGRYFNMVVKLDNSLWGAGDNGKGELGIGDNLTQSGLAKLMDNVQSVSVGNFYSFVIKTDKTLWSTGENANGQLGDGTKTNKNSFVKVNSNVKYISTGGNTTFIVKDDNTVWASGYNQTGKLGDGTTYDRPIFVPINVK